MAGMALRVFLGEEKSSQGSLVFLPLHFHGGNLVMLGTAPPSGPLPSARGICPAAHERAFPVLGKGAGGFSVR